MTDDERQSVRLNAELDQDVAYLNDRLYYLEAFRHGRWTLLGCYRGRKYADRMAADYRKHGEKVRIKTDES